MSLHRRSAIIAPFLVVSIIAAACSSSSKSSSPTTSSQGSSSTAAAPSGPPIVLGLVTTVQSQAFSFPQIPIAAKVAAKAVNAAGGVNGRPVEIDFCDDQAAPSVATTCAQKLVSQDHVTALVGSVSAQGASMYPFLTQAGVADFANYPSSAPDFSDPLSFPLVPGALELAGLPAIAPKGAKNVALIYDPAGAIAWTFFQAGAKKLGLNPIGIQVASTTVSYDPIIAQINNDHVDAVSDSATAGLTQFLSAMSSEGPNVPIDLFSGELSAAALTASKSVHQPINATLGLSFSGATRQEFLSDASKYGPGLGLTDTNSLSTVNAWLGVKVLAKLMQPLSSITPQTVTAALRQQSALETGLTPTLNLAAAGPSSTFPRLVNTHIYSGQVSQGEIHQTSATAIDVSP
ncbi:MAG: ABC transporter substrate-binding protein [Acidimicrobiales bacterium]|nr:ABC transporter substrate-binding protein [Acidimicrobiales bacterium]